MTKSLIERIKLCPVFFFKFDYFRGMEIPYWMSRTQLMLGDEKIVKLMSANVLVVGL